MSTQLEKDLALIGRWSSEFRGEYALLARSGLWFVTTRPDVGQAPTAYGNLSEAIHDTAKGVVAQVLRLNAAVPAIIGDWTEDEP